jgi:probable O-glycosylation ligase (exosortase A-associated)
MPTSELFDYEPIRRPRRSPAEELAIEEQSWKPVRLKESDSQSKEFATEKWRPWSGSTEKTDEVKGTTHSIEKSHSVLQHGHGLSFLGLFLFTILVYLRPYELFPSLSWLSKSAFWVALSTLIVFVPTQLGLENRLTIRTREVNLVLLFALAALLSIPFALDPTRAYGAFVEYLKVVLMFIIMVNVVRTNTRLMMLVALILLISCGLSIGALHDYIIGNFALNGQRIEGLVGGLFSNPNDLALHLVTFAPISFVSALSTRSLIKKLLFLSATVIVITGIMATFSRGGFIGLLAVTLFLAWKLASRHRILVFAGGLLLVTTFLFVAPRDYRSRLATTSDDSATARIDDLKRSAFIALRHPVFGVGMDNYILYSNSNHVTHNAYTQVAAELGFPALVIYLFLLAGAMKSLKKVEKGSESTGNRERFYYLSIGLQASLIGFMASSFFASVAYFWYLYYLVGYAVCITRLFHARAHDQKDYQATSVTNYPTFSYR